MNSRNLLNKIRTPLLKLCPFASNAAGLKTANQYTEGKLQMHRITPSIS